MTAVRSTAPISPDDRVSDVLARDETLVDVFVRQAPHFAKLRNRAMRRIMARLITVEQAARTANIPVDLLVRELNAALGIEGDGSPQSVVRMKDRSSDDARQHPASASVVELDVREDLRSGREPFSRIMSAVAALRDDHVLRLRTTFEPVPLFTVLGKRGFVHESEARAPDDWSVWFWRTATPDVAVQPESTPASTTDDIPPDDERTTYLDVRGSSPPEPLMRTLAALESLPRGRTLVQINNRVPQFLLPVLDERGFAFDIDDSQPDRVLVRISHAQQVASHHTLSTHHTDMPTNGTSSTIELDVRVIPPRQKHPTIFDTFDGLASGQSMVIINDHDPRPLRYQLAAERADQFAWTYEEEGPEVWRVRIDRR